jgi:hypothetical protein
MSQASPDMSTILFETYGTNKTASHTAEDQQKVAEAELFLGLCKNAGIDPQHLTDEQIGVLWKAASGEDKGEKPMDKKKEEEAKKGEEKKASATREWQEKRAMAEKVAEADSLGRIMAHAYVDELKKIGSSNKVAELPPQFMKNVKGKGDEKPEEKKPEGKSEDKGDKDEDEKKKESQDRANALIAKLASGTSSTPSLDEQSALHAVEILKQAGYDANVAMSRINAIHTLGLPESSKIASASTADDAVVVRSLEYCEAAGFPVDWSKV